MNTIADHPEQAAEDASLLDNPDTATTAIATRDSTGQRRRTVRAGPRLDPNNDIDGHGRSEPACDCIYNILFILYYFFCLVTGQLQLDAAKKVDTRWKFGLLFINALSFLFMLIVSGVNIGSLAFDLAVIIYCPYRYCGYISVPYITRLINTSEALNVSNTSLINAVQPINLTIFDDWQKTVFTTATVSGTISYLFMIYVLNHQYNCFKCCGSLKKKISGMWQSCGEVPKFNFDPEGTIAVVRSPFHDDKKTTENSNESTRLQPKQATYFLIIFILNILVYAGNVTLLFVIFRRNVDRRYKTREIINGLGLAAQVASQLCAVISCFIFSKLAYSVSTTCRHDLLTLYRKVNEASRELEEARREHNDNNIVMNINLPSIQWLRERRYIIDSDIDKKNNLHLLKAIANWYTRLVHSTLHPFGTWFAVHWVLYTVSAFMSISYLAETIILELYGKERPDVQCHGEHSFPCRLKLAYTFLFTINHCILFLYPCFRAASVTTAYSSMIKLVSKDTWANISLDDKEKFINYLKVQDCTFKISILCAKLSFGFQVAYFSIFVGLFGVVLKLAL